MGKQRLEAFTDGVLAVIITIMVLELSVPSGSNFSALKSSLPILLTYALSFTNVGIFWNNHHHMLHATERINGMVLWANLSLLFCISLDPVRNPLDERNSFCLHAHGLLRRGLGHGGDRLPLARASHHRVQRSLFKD